MRPLVTCHRVLILLSSCATEGKLGLRESCAIYFLAPFTLFVDVSFIIVSGVYFMRFKSIDLEDSMHALSQILAAMPVTNMIIAMFILRHKIAAMFQSLSEIYKISKKILPKHSISHIKCLG